jgi:hypothetical protein
MPEQMGPATDELVPQEWVQAQISLVQEGKEIFLSGPVAVQEDIARWKNVGPTPHHGTFLPCPVEDGHPEGNPRGNDGVFRRATVETNLDVLVLAAYL